MGGREQKGFWRDHGGQDLAEWCLITAFLALVALGIFWHVSGGLQSLWTNANSTLVTGSGPVDGNNATQQPQTH
jgi:Flp pilus assembly pilin Flp